MKTDCSPFGNLEKQDKNYLLSATFGWIAGVLHIPNNNKISVSDIPLSFRNSG